MYTINDLTQGVIQDDFIIVFSGGVDSTYLLLKAVETVKGKNKGNISVIYHRSHYINRKKGTMEEISISKIIDKIKKDYEIDISTITHNMDIDFNMECDMFDNDVDLILPQSILWNSVILSCLPAFGDVNANIVFGFTVDDNLPAYSMNIIKRNIEDSYNLLRFGNGVLNVISPLMTYNKNKIYKYMLNNYYDYFKLTWSCECPNEIYANKFIECGKCNPCITKANTINSIISNVNNNMTQLYNKLDNRYIQKDYEQLIFKELNDKEGICNAEDAGKAKER